MESVLAGLQLYGSLKLVVLLFLFSGVLRAQPAVQIGGDSLMESSFIMVPELESAFTLALSFENSFPRALGESALQLPHQHLRAHLGYMNYLDPRGRNGLGLYLGGGLSLPQAELGKTLRLDLGLHYRKRFITPQFHHASLGAFLEGGVLFLRDAPARQDGLWIVEPAERAWRVALGVETGVGTLWSLRPYLWGELAPRMGLEFISHDGIEEWRIFGMINIQFDWGQRLDQGFE